MTITTRYGNQYSEIEWAEMMSNWDKDIAETEDYLDKEEKILSIAAKKLVSEVGIDERKSYSIARHIYDNSTDGIQFTSAEKKAAIEKIDAWMTEQCKSM